jgi:hypothetical protein
MQSVVMPMILLFFLDSATGTQRAILDTDVAYPYISLLDPVLDMDWDRGFGALGIAQSSAVRINSKGIQFIPPSYSQLDLSDRYQTTCVRSRNCMCVMDNNGSTTNVFPEKGSPVYITPDVETPINLVCHRQQTGRQVLLGSLARMDISLCNIIDGNMDIVYIPTTNTIYVTHHSINTPVIVIICLLVLYVAAMMCHNIEILICKKASITSGNIYTDNFAIYVLVGLTVFCEGEVNALRPFVTIEDKFSFVVLVIYIMYYVIQNTHNILYGSPANPINTLIAVLTAVSMRIHMTLDNAYTSILTFIFILRVLNKIWNMEILDATENVHMHTRDLVADAFMSSTLLFVGIVPQYGNDPMTMTLYLTQGISVALLLNSFINTLESKIAV